MRLSFYDIWTENVYDLLDKGTKKHGPEDRQKQAYVEGLREVPVTSAGHKRRGETHTLVCMPDYYGIL